METATAAAASQLVVFSLAGEEYAVPITQVQEIIEYTEPRTVASDSSWTRGVISLRGKILPVFDVLPLLGLVHEHDGSANIVIVEAGSDLGGIIVENVTEVLTVEPETIEPLPGAAAALVSSVAKIGDRLVVLLDVGALFAATA